MRLPKKKPKILTEKIKLANLIKAKWKRLKGLNHPFGFYWSGTYSDGKFFEEDPREIYVMFQLYARRKTVDYVDLRWENGDRKGKAMTVTEIRNLIKELTNGKA